MVGENFPHPLCLCGGDDDAVTLRLPLFQCAGQQFHLSPERFDPGEANRDLDRGALGGMQRREAQTDHVVGPVRHVLPRDQRPGGCALQQRARLALQFVGFVQDKQRRTRQVVEQRRAPAAFGYGRQQRHR